MLAMRLSDNLVGHLKLYSVIGFLIFLCLICYCESLNGKFVFDDSVAIVNNQDVSDVSTQWKNIFKHDFWGYNLTDKTSHKSYRPLTTLTFRLEYGHLKLNSYEMKIINLIFHCINSCLSFLVFNKIMNNFDIAVLGSTLFAIHPVHVEVVCGIVSRAELLFCFSNLIAVLIFSQLKLDQKKLYNEWFKLFSLIIIAVIGLLFKESAIMILPTCIYYDLVMRTNLFYKTINRFHVKKIVLKRFALLIIVTISLLMCRLYMQNFESPKFKKMDNIVASSDSIFSRILSQNFLYVLNLWILICPIWLCFDWALGCITLIDWINDYRCLTIIVLYIMLYCLIKTRCRITYLGLGFLILPFVPASGLINLGFVIAERVLYVPSIGYCLLIAQGVTLLRNHKFKMLSQILLGCLILTLTMRTRQRAGEWQSETKLFLSGLKVCPNNAKVHYNLARLATDMGNKSFAFEHYHRAISLYPEYEAALMNLGNLYRENGNYDSAEKYLKKSIEILDEFPAAWMNLGILQAHTKRFDEALFSYRKALSYKKSYPTCLYNLGNLYLDLKNYSEAIKNWQESVTLNPKLSKAWANILTLLDNRGLHEDALKMSDRAIKFLKEGDDLTTIQFIRANVLGKTKNYIEAEELFLKVIEKKPENAIYNSNLGVLYHRWEKHNKAQKYYERALNLDPNMKSTKENLEKLLKNQFS